MKSINRNISYLISGFIFAAILATGCRDNSTDSDPSGEFDIQVSSNSTHGKVLTDGEGNALYVFGRDVSGESMCTGNCIANWPAFFTEELRLGDGLTEESFGTITRSDGSSQITFSGWPLYYYNGDESTGTISGDGVGDIWYVAKPAYSLMIASQQLIGHDEISYLIDEDGTYQEGEKITSHIVDIQGRTLYIFINDSANTNNFTAEDFSNDGVWPIFDGNLTSHPSGLDATHFDSIDVYGRQQLTYKGWPLYYFGQDEMQRGNTKGVSFPRPGVWPVTQKGMPAAPGYSSGDNSTSVAGH